jgi:two-component system NtrC family response regulator
MGGRRTPPKMLWTCERRTPNTAASRQHRAGLLISMSAERLATIVPLPLPDGDYRALVEVLVEISRGGDLPSTFRALARGVSRLTTLDWLGVAWRGTQDGDPTLHASLAGQPDWLATSTPLSRCEGALALWFLPELPRVVGPERTALATQDPNWPVPASVDALLTVPLPRSGGGSRRGGQREQARGAVVLGRTGRGPFDPGLVALLEPIAAHVAVLLERTEWLERFRATNTELRQRLLEQAATVTDAPVPTLPDVDRPDWIAEDPAALDAVELAERAAATDLAVLVDGESGTGKELMARRVHELSPRRERAFVALNVAALTPELVGSELFGHRAGAFTGARGDRKGLVEEADGGTLFLDEIGDMPLALQPVLLRFLEDGQVRRLGDNRPRRLDVRLVCATNRDLLAEIVAGRFREDLYHRVAQVVVRLPPLRERPGDLPLLANRFLAEASAGRYRTVPPPWWEPLRRYHWPGNVRELRNAMVSVGKLSRGDEPESRFLPAPLRMALDGDAGSGRAHPWAGWTLAEVEREQIRTTLVACGGHRGRAAARLGIPARSLYDKVRRYGLEDAAG